MSDQNTTADACLIEALKRITSLVEGEYKKAIRAPKSNHDMGCVVNDSQHLIAAHAQLTLLSYGIERIASALEGGRAALGEIAESVDFLAARPDVNAASEVPTKRERELMYHTLEADMLENCPPEKIEEMDAALLRFKKLAGL
jgi:hypothetical protein